MWNPIARVAALGLSLRPLPPLSIAVGARLTWVRMGQDIRRSVAVEDPAARRVLNDPLSCLAGRQVFVPRSQILYKVRSKAG